MEITSRFRNNIPFLRLSHVNTELARWASMAVSYLCSYLQKQSPDSYSKFLLFQENHHPTGKAEGSDRLPIFFSSKDQV